MKSLRNPDRRRDIDIYYSLHLLKMSYANLMHYVIRIPNPWNRSFSFCLKNTNYRKMGLKFVCLLFRMFYLDSNVILSLLTDIRVSICPPFPLLFAKKQLIRKIFHLARSCIMWQQVRSQISLPAQSLRRRTRAEISTTFVGIQWLLQISETFSSI